MGIHPNTLYRWVKQFSDKPEAAFPGKGYLVSSEAETIRGGKLKRENERLKMERDILKKAHGPSFPATRSNFSVYEHHRSEFPIL